MSTSQQARPLRRVAGFLAGFLALFFLAVVAVSVLHGRGSGPLSWRSGRVVAILPLEGEIRRSDDFVETLDELRTNDSIAAVVIRIDSPGGAVAPAQEMYTSIRRLAEAKPVIASLGSVAASGGYYVASATDVIVASPGTLTGSIGVIMSLTNVSGLLEKVGVEADVLKAGAQKDMGSPFRPLSSEDRAIFQTMLDEVHTQFIDAVAAGRKMEPARARTLADGRIFTGQQAKELGLVDELGGLDAAVRTAAERSGITGEPTIERVSPARRPWWLRALTSEEVRSSRHDIFAALFEWLEGQSATGGPEELLWRMPVVTRGVRW